MDKQNTKIFVISGPSGVGKNAIISELLKIFPNSQKVLNTTSRKERKGEKNLEDYRFLSVEDFVSKFERGEFLEAGQYLGNVYGTLKSDFKKAREKAEIVFWILDVKGVKSIKKDLENISYIFVKPDKSTNVNERLEVRNLDNAEKRGRIKQAGWEISESGIYDHIVINHHGKMNETVKEMVKIIKKETAKEF